MKEKNVKNFYFTDKTNDFISFSLKVRKPCFGSIFGLFRNFSQNLNFPPKMRSDTFEPLGKFTSCAKTNKCIPIKKCHKQRNRETDAQTD